jgi:DNA-binding CsgD family transcriptional regulator
VRGVQLQQISKSGLSALDWPHLKRAFQLHTRIHGLDTKGNSATEVLDHFDQGVVLLDARGRVLLVNQVATALFGAERTLRLTARGLIAAVPFENKQLANLVHGAIATGSGKSLHAGGAMTVSRRGLRRPLQLLVTPLRTRTVHLDKQTPVVAIFISDPDRKPISRAAVLVQLFGLTPAEARLAQLLASGSDLKQASECLGVTRSTLRSQLKSVFGKTNTNSQSQLVRLIMLTPSRVLRSTIPERLGYTNDITLEMADIIYAVAPCCIRTLRIGRTATDSWNLTSFPE